VNIFSAARAYYILKEESMQTDMTDPPLNETGEYPADWDVSKKNAGEQGPSEFLKFKTGEKQRLRVIVGPLAFCELFVEGAGEGGKGKSYRFPTGTTIPGQKRPTAKYAFEVLLLDGPEAGAHKLWTCGQQVADQLREIKETWTDIRKCDIMVGKTGEKLKTKWRADGVPPSKVEETSLKPIFNLREKIKYATAEEIQAMPKASAPADSLDGPVSAAQKKEIEDLCSVKDVSQTDLNKIVGRKAPGKVYPDLNAAEAVKVIEALRAY
jgi:hypothetical protein